MSNPTAWSSDEVELIVADYFAMLRQEMAGERVNKAEHNRRLQARLNNRSSGSIEFKHANITAALLSIGDYPGIDGYKPRWNYQASLEKAILEYLAGEPDFYAEVAQSPVVDPVEPVATDFADPLHLVEAPPEPTPFSRVRVAGANIRKVDFARIDAENRRLGRRGEEWALEFERRRLHDAEKRPDLSKRVIWVSDAEGDGAGYDIRSFNADESVRLIEVKTTGLPKYAPFAVSDNEVRVSEREADRYHLYRVFRFGTDPRLYWLPGALSATCRLDPTQYRARAGRVDPC